MTYRYQYLAKIRQKDYINDDLCNFAEKIPLESELGKNNTNVL